MKDIIRIQQITDNSDPLAYCDICSNPIQLNQIETTWGAMELCDDCIVILYRELKKFIFEGDVTCSE